MTASPALYFGANAVVERIGEAAFRRKALSSTRSSIYSRDHGVPKDFLWIQRNSVDTLSADWIKGRTG
jgi:hypothetical protein